MCDPDYATTPIAVGGADPGSSYAIPYTGILEKRGAGGGCLSTCADWSVGGGGSGAAAIGTCSVTPGATLQVTVGKRGTMSAHPLMAQSVDGLVILQW